MTETTRRAVVLGAGGAGLAVVMTACASYGSPTAQPSEAPPADEPSSAAPKKKKAAGKALAETGDIPSGGGKVFESQKVVVTQPTEGEFKAFTAICTHQGCTVDEVADGTINCPCHGSKFKISDGSVAGGPASKPLAEKKIKVSDGKITLA
ncbi:Rieske (2Fe-2S) protein [Nonomuraea aurantiaca]|uniref:Rieske (2Fe-2S) protein n=1 Tax=Nonomuraea aurantiaca TaxID=2878562 RepID=UPI001CD945FD|nr:Rieske (2Fe-2S) protein [Nonomuraea aurantiaca]MCA2222321.1 Rieske (2Fe-2S) protein [Nonomuraea aurantiaca]